MKEGEEQLLYPFVVSSIFFSLIFLYSFSALDRNRVKRGLELAWSQWSTLISFIPTILPYYTITVYMFQ